MKGLAAVAASVFITASAHGQEIQFIFGTGTAHPYGRGISADGSTLIGTESDGMGIRWRAETGVQSIGLLPLTTRSTTEGVSGDGSIVVGSSFPTQRAFRWTPQTGIQLVSASLGQTDSAAMGVSADGEAIVGWYTVDTAQRAFRWTELEGLQLLPTLNLSYGSFAHAVSANGGVVVGSDSGLAVRWVGTGIASMGVLPGRARSQAWAVSADGRAAAGDSSNTPGDYVAFRWTITEGIQSLGVLPGMTSAQALAISGDGQMVGGQSGGRAFLWTPALGMVNLNDYATSLGINLGSAVLAQVTGISHDGTVLAGSAWLPGYTTPIAFRLVIPAPGALGMCAGALLCGGYRRRRPCMKA